MEFLKTPDKKAILETTKTWKNIGQGETYGVLERPKLENAEIPVRRWVKGPPQNQDEVSSSHPLTPSLCIMPWQPTPRELRHEQQ